MGKCVGDASKVNCIGVRGVLGLEGLHNSKGICVKGSVLMEG